MKSYETRYSMSALSACNAQAGMSIGMVAGDTGMGRINEGVWDGATSFVTGIIIGEPPFFQTVAKCLIRVKRTAFPAARLNITPKPRS